jgi:hypothetical protein
MKNLLVTVAALSLLTFAPAASAEGTTMGGLGFHAGSSPFDGFGFLTGRDFAAPSVGVRQWFSDKLGGDVGVGFFNLSAKPGEDKLTGVMVSVGVPILLKRLDDRVNFILRPGFAWGTQTEELGPPPVVKTTWTAMAITGELEAEWMVTEHLGVSASHGIAWGKIHDDGTPETEITSIGTLQNNFTQLGFTAYLW